MSGLRREGDSTMFNVLMGSEEVSMDDWFDRECEKLGGHVIVRHGKLLCVEEGVWRESP